MNTARLIHRPRVRHAAAVSAGALALCLSGVGPAYADTLPTAPGVPSPDNVITTLDQTVTQLTGTDPGLTSPGTVTPPGTTPPTSQQPPPAPSTGTSTARPTVKAPRTTTRHVWVKRPAAPHTATSNVTWVAATNAGALSLPPATTTAAAAGAAPAVAPLLMPQVTQRITPAAAIAEADKHTGSPVRGILLTLAIAAALALGYEHGRLARQGAAA